MINSEQTKTTHYLHIRTDRRSQTTCFTDKILALYWLLTKLALKLWKSRGTNSVPTSDVVTQADLLQVSAGKSGGFAAPFRDKSSVFNVVGLNLIKLLQKVTEVFKDIKTNNIMGL